MFQVTSYHEQVGSIVDSIETPLHGGFRLAPGSTRTDKQSYVIGLCVMMGTSQIMPPLLSSLEHYWTSQWEVARWENLQRNLRALSKTVEMRNATAREYAVQSGNPAFLDIAIVR